jgi:uncharacterized protein YwqG
VLDRGQSIQEKYGNSWGWKLQLRHDENRIGDIVEFKENVGGKFSGICSQTKDDRWKPIEIIRKNKDLNEAMGNSGDYEQCPPKVRSKNLLKHFSSERKRSV